MPRLNVTPVCGAYGFRLVSSDPEVVFNDLVPLAADAPAVTVGWRHASLIGTIEHVSDDRVALGARGASAMHVERRPPTITLDLEEPPDPDALLHPTLTVPMSVLARWRGDVTLHAGAFETPAGAWGVAGMREAGKSTLLASLAMRGCPVVADDLLTVLDGAAWAGPTCVDLRPDAAERFDGSRCLGEVGGRPRYRLSTAPGRAQQQLRGLFVPGWHDEPGVTIEPMGSKDRLRLLYGQEYIGLLGPADPREILKLLGLPAWRVLRPRDWEATDEVAERVLAVAAQG